MRVQMQFTHNSSTMEAQVCVCLFWSASTLPIWGECPILLDLYNELLSGTDPIDAFDRASLRFTNNKISTKAVLALQISDEEAFWGPEPVFSVRYQSTYCCNDVLLAVR